MKNYNKPEFEFVRLTAEEKFAGVGSVCTVVGECDDPNIPGYQLLVDGPM